MFDRNSRTGIIFMAKLYARCARKNTVQVHRTSSPSSPTSSSSMHSSEQSSHLSVNFISEWIHYTLLCCKCEQTNIPIYIIVNAISSIMQPKPQSTRKRCGIGIPLSRKMKNMTHHWSVYVCLGACVLSVQSSMVSIHEQQIDFILHPLDRCQWPLHTVI